MTHDEFLNSLPKPPERILHPAQIKFSEDLKAGKQIPIAEGIFGPETPSSDGYIEEVIRPEGGGKFYKIYGCSYLYKGTIEHETVRGISLAKSLFSDTSMKFLKNPAFALAGLFIFVFQRNKLLQAVLHLVKEIEERVMQWYNIPERDYNVFTKEIKRCVDLALKEVRWSIWVPIIKKMTNFVCLVLETDTAYRFRFQDAIHEAINRDNLTIDGVFGVLMERETYLGIGRKWRLIRPLLKVCIFLSPTLRSVVNRVLRSLNPEKVKLDEHDWYFCLRYLSYNFKGRSAEHRKAEQKELDELNGHQFLI